MDGFLGVALSHQKAMLKNMDVIANNVANASTTAFKGERLTFHERVEQMKGDAPRPMRRLSFVTDTGSRADFSEGAIIKTGNTLDIALHGDGFLVVRNDAGEQLYTRRGSLQMRADGALILPSGEQVLDNNDEPIELNPDNPPITIAEDGTLLDEIVPIAQLQIVDFPNPDILQRRGNSLFASDLIGNPAEGVRVLQGSLEQSNVNPIKEITRMISVMRSYQAMQRNLDDFGETRERAIDRLPLVQG